MTVTNFTKEKIIIDTDPGHDDALAILLLEKSGLFDILALTTVAGNSSIADTTNNARFILDLIGSTVPIYSGAEKPLVKDLITAEVHGTSGLAGADVVKVEPLTANATEKIIEMVRSNPYEISIVVIGPHTNIAQAFLKDPELPTLVKQLIIMGGAIEVPGNKNRVGEFNIFIDPDAADIVFRADVKKVLITLDSSNHISLSLEDFEGLSGSKLYHPIIQMMKPYISGIMEFEHTFGALMYDPLAAYYLINPDAYETELMDIKIETMSELTRGMTVADRRLWGEKDPNVFVVTKIQKEMFVADFLRILKND